VLAILDSKNCVCVCVLFVCVCVLFSPATTIKSLLIPNFKWATGLGNQRVRYYKSFM
jgi:hypothetical protein